MTAIGRMATQAEGPQRSAPRFGAGVAWWPQVEHAAGVQVALREFERSTTIAVLLGPPSAPLAARRRPGLHLTHPWWAFQR